MPQSLSFRCRSVGGSLEPVTSAGVRRSSVMGNSHARTARFTVTVSLPQLLLALVYCLQAQLKASDTECTYDQPSNRRRNPAPQYVEALEARLERAEALLRTVLPDVNLDDPSDEVDMTHQMQPVMKQEPGESTGVDTLAPLARPSIGPERGSESLLESMVENTGSLDLDEEGHFDFHGNSSGIVFLRCLRDQFGDLTGKAEGYGMPFLKSRKVSSPLNSPKSEGSFGPLAESISSNKEELPQKESARLLCQCALDDACALLRFVHQPTFWSKFDRAYDIPSDQYSHEETHFLPLLYSVLAVGALFAKAEWSHLQKLGYEDAIEQGQASLPMRL